MAAEKAALEAERNWLTIEETQAELGAGSRTAVATLIASGRLAAEKVGRLWQISKTSVDALLATGYRPALLDRFAGEDREALDQRVALLHDLGQTPGQIAKTCRLSKPTVYDSLSRSGRKRKGQGQKSRWLEPEARAQRVTASARLYTQENFSTPQIAEKLGSSQSQIRRDLEAAGVTLRPRGSQTKYPPAAPRECEYCGTIFVPKHPSFDAGKRRRFCSDECARNHRKAAAATVAEAGLLTTEETGRLLGVSSHRIGDYVRSYGLRARELTFPGALRPVLGFDVNEVERFRTEYARGG